MPGWRPRNDGLHASEARCWRLPRPHPHRHLHGIHPRPRHRHNRCGVDRRQQQPRPHQPLVPVRHSHRRPWQRLRPHHATGLHCDGRRLHTVRRRGLPVHCGCGSQRADRHPRHRTRPRPDRPTPRPVLRLRDRWCPRRTRGVPATTRSARQAQGDRGPRRPHRPRLSPHHQPSGVAT